MSYGAISGILSAHTLLLAKTAVELLVRTIVDHVNQFNQWQSWMILLGLIALALTQLYYLHRGLKLCSTSVLYPFVFCVYNVIAILDGLIYFDQGSRLPISDAVLIAVGTVVLLGGVFALSWRLKADDDLNGPTAVDIKAKARVVTPRTILQPGMGLTEEPESDYEEEEQYLRPADDEDALGQARNLHATEHTPLLRTKTGPMRVQAHLEHRDAALRPPKLRRMTTIRDDSTIDLWDELNDRPSSGRFSGDYSPHSVRSPAASRSLHRRSTSGPRKSKTLPSRRRSSGKQTMPFAWRIFRSSSSRKRAASRDFVSSPPPTTNGEDSEGDEHDDNTQRQDSWLLGSGEGSGRNEPKPGWFKMQWWKKRWRSEDDSSSV
jgi:hypothetical protein